MPTTTSCTRNTAWATAQVAFGAAKEDALPGICRACDFRFACPTQVMNAMAELVSRGLPASTIMQAFEGSLVISNA